MSLALVASTHASLPNTVSLTAAPNATTEFLGSALSSGATNLAGGINVSHVYTTQQGTVTLCGGNISYTPANGFVGQDTFGYTITNSTGGLTSLQASVTVRPALPIVLTSGTARLQLAGAAGSNYYIQASTDLLTWATIGSAVADSHGVVAFADTNAASVGSRYYRISVP